MAIFHLSAKINGRATGKSAVAAAAYRSREVMTDERTGNSYDYRYRGKEESEIIAPENSPEWATDRARLWNEVERAERRCNSQTYREIEVAMPKELSWAEQRKLVRDFVQENYTKQRIVADIAYHRNNDGNPHAHIMLTTRSIGPDGFGPKNREMNSREALESWRESWELQANTALERSGREERIDRRSLKDQGVDREPTKHLGPKATALERAGAKTELGEYNAKVIELEDAKKRLAALKKERAAAEVRVRDMVSRTPGATRLNRLERHAEWSALRAEANANFWDERVSRFDRMRQQSKPMSPRDLAREKNARVALIKSEKRLIEAKATHGELAKLVGARPFEERRVMALEAQAAPSQYIEAVRTRARSEVLERRQLAALASQREELRYTETLQTREARLRAAYYSAERKVRDLSQGGNKALRATPQWVPGAGGPAQAARAQYSAAIEDRERALKGLKDLATAQQTTVRALPGALEAKRQSGAERLALIEDEARRLSAATIEAKRLELAHDVSGQHRFKGAHRLGLAERHRQRLQTGLWNPQASRDLRRLEAAQGRALTDSDWNTLREARGSLSTRDLRALRGYEAAAALNEYRTAARAGGPRDTTRDAELQKNALGALKELDSVKHDHVVSRAAQRQGHAGAGAKRGAAIAGGLVAAAMGEALRVEKEARDDRGSARGTRGLDRPRDLSRGPTQKDPGGEE